MLQPTLPLTPHAHRTSPLQALFRKYLPLIILVAVALLMIALKFYF